MGYSSRYHAASLAAVFLALAIGILIGVGFGDNVLTNTKKNLEASLTGDLEAARSRSDQLNGQLNRADEFAQRIYPALVRGELRGQRIGVVALGGLPNGLSTDIQNALNGLPTIGGTPTTETMVSTLIMLFCAMLIRPSTASSRNWILLVRCAS